MPCQQKQNNSPSRLKTKAYITSEASASAKISKIMTQTVYVEVIAFDAWACWSLKLRGFEGNHDGKVEPFLMFMKVLQRLKISFVANDFVVKFFDTHEMSAKVMYYTQTLNWKKGNGIPLFLFTMFKIEHIPKGWTQASSCCYPFFNYLFGLRQMGKSKTFSSGYMIGWLPLLISKQSSIQCGKVLTLVFRYIKAFHDDGRRCLTENEQPTFSISFYAQSIERKRSLMHNTFFRTNYRRLKIE